MTYNTIFTTSAVQYTLCIVINIYMHLLMSYINRELYATLPVEHTEG